MTTVSFVQYTSLRSALAIGATAMLCIGLTACSSDGTKTAAHATAGPTSGAGATRPAGTRLALQVTARQPRSATITRARW